MGYDRGKVIRQRVCHLALGILLLNTLTGAASQPGSYDVTQYGALPDGKTVNTASIQAAIDACTASGGGVVSFPSGAFLSGTLYLKSHVHLRLEQGATLLGSTDLADYPVNHCAYPSRSDEYTARALLWAEGAEDIGITGAGTIDGQGSAFRDRKASPEEMAETTKALEQEGRYTPQARYFSRPYIIRFITCRNVFVEGVHLRNSPMWMQHYLDCDFVTLRGLNVFNHGSSNNDMVDIDGCRNVIVSDCFGDSDDDALTLKSTGARATEHVTITNCILRSHCNAIKAGTESAGGFKDIAISNCVIQRSAVEGGAGGRREGLAGIALEVVDGGTLERVSISNIVIEGTSAPLFMRLGNRGRAPKTAAPKPAVGSFHDVSVSNITATGAGKQGCSITGLPGHCIENVNLSNIHITFAGGGSSDDTRAEVPEVEDKYPECTMFGPLPAYGFYLRHVNNLHMSNVDFHYSTPDTRPALAADDVRDLLVDSLRAQTEPNALAQMTFTRTCGALITGCAPTAVQTLLFLGDACESVRLLNNDLTRVSKPCSLAPGTPPSAVTAAFNLLP